MPRPVASALAALVLIALAGCSSTHSRSVPAAAAGPRLPFTACTTRMAPAPPLSHARNEFRSLPADPFGIVTTADGRWSFVSFPHSIGVLSDRAFPPRLVRTIPLAGTSVGEALTPDGELLLVADRGSGAAVLDARRAERGLPGALVARLSSPGGRGAIEVALTPDGRDAFVSLEGSSEIAVFDLARDAFAGAIRVGPAPVGMAISPDGRWMYATSELGAGRDGVLSVIDLARARTAPGRAIVSRVVAGCSPVRVVTSHHGAIVWVTARGGDELLGFSAAALREHPRRALIARAYVGSAPVGLIPVDDGRLIVVADSDRFAAGGSAGDLRVLRSAALLAGRPGVQDRLAAGTFPREMALEPGGRTLLVTDYGSRQLQAIDLAGAR